MEDIGNLGHAYLSHVYDEVLTGKAEHDVPSKAQRGSLSSFMASIFVGLQTEQQYSLV